MQCSLKQRTDRDRAAALENARIRTALDKAAGNIMVADTDGKIVYMNESVVSMFRSNATEIRKHLPQFDPDRVLGANFDSFHGIRRTRETCSPDSMECTPPTSCWRRVPADHWYACHWIGSAGGTVVQWIDRTQEVSIEQEVQDVVTKALDGGPRAAYVVPDGFAVAIPELMGDALVLKRPRPRHGHLSRRQVEQAQTIFDVHRDKAFVDEQRQVRIRGRALHVSKPIVLVILEHHRDLSRIYVD